MIPVVPMLPTGQDVLDVAMEAAYQAGGLIRAEAGRISPEDVASKGVHDVVTRVDKAAQSLIVSAIKAAFPSHLVLAEEEVHHDFTPVAPPGSFRWIIDPIDGTTNFLHGVPPFAVSIGVQFEDRMLAGVVYDVSRDEMFTGTSGQPLRINGRTAAVSRVEDLDKALLTTGFPYREFEHVDAYLTVLRAFMERAQGVRRPGSSAVDLAWVASGRYDGFFETGLAPWDVAAGILLVECGGGRVTDYTGRTNPVFSRQVLASNGLLHDTMLEMVTPMCRVRS